jgi:hypothetical protein
LRDEVAQLCLQTMKLWDGPPGKIIAWMQDGAVTEPELASLFAEFRRRSISRSQAVLKSYGVPQAEALARATLLWGAIQMTCTSSVKGMLGNASRRALAEAFADMFVALRTPSGAERVVRLAACNEDTTDA